MNITLQVWHLVALVALSAAYKMRLHRALFIVFKFFAMLLVMTLASICGIEIIDPREKRHEVERKTEEIKQRDPDVDHDDKMRNWVWDQSYSGQFVSLQASHMAAAEGVVPITPFDEWRAEFLGRVARQRGA